MAEKLWTSYDSQSQLDAPDKLLVSCSGVTKNTTMNDIYNYVCAESGSTGVYQYHINADLIREIPVNFNNINNGAMLQYNSSNQQWDFVYRTNADKIFDINVSPATPTDGQVLMYSASGNQYYPADVGGAYTLPTASADTKGGVKIGSGLTMTGDVLSATGGGGADGLSAYASAQLGGYTDTEAAFYADLAAMQGLDAALEALL